MAQMWGADADALDDLARRFSSSAANLEGTGTALRALVQGAPWGGGDATEFRTAWDGTYMRSMQSAAAFLQTASDLLVRQAGDQRQASRSTGVEDGGVAAPGTTLPNTLEETKQYLLDHVDPDDYEGVDLIGKGGDRTTEEIRSRLRHALDHATDSELTIIRDLLQRGLTSAQLQEFLKGGHIWIDDPGLYDSWRDLDGAGDRQMSSHYKGEMSDQQIELESDLFGAALIGRARGGTWIQLEMYSEEDPKHGITYGDYKYGDGQNVGPYGKSDASEANPIELGGHRPPKVDVGDGGAW